MTSICIKRSLVEKIGKAMSGMVISNVRLVMETNIRLFLVPLCQDREKVLG